MIHEERYDWSVPDDLCSDGPFCLPVGGGALWKRDPSGHPSGHWLNNHKWGVFIGTRGKKSLAEILLSGKVAVELLDAPYEPTDEWRAIVATMPLKCFARAAAIAKGHSGLAWSAAAANREFPAFALPADWEWFCKTAEPS
jgi:hypothetical protein